jgi:hypothetical protein
LSARSIEHVQRELAHVQKKLEEAGTTTASGETTITEECLLWASDYLAQLTNGDLRRLMLFNQGRNAVVVNERGESIALDLLSAAQRDQVYLSVCLSLLTAASRHGVWLPLVLDEPFERLDSRATAALAAVLEGFARQGHQIVLFTQRTDAAERLAAVGAEMRDMIDLRRAPVDVVPVDEAPAHAVAIVREAPMVTRRTDGPISEIRRRKKKIVPASRKGDGPDTGHSDAA